MPEIKSISGVLKTFKDDLSILHQLFIEKYKAQQCKNDCGLITETYKHVKKRRCYQCSKCRNQVYPTKGTIFEGSTTSLADWMCLIFDVCDDGKSANRFKRRYNVTYKTAWRISYKIRELISKNDMLDQFTGTVEIDESFFGGKRYLSQMNSKPTKTSRKKRKAGTGKGIADTQPVFGMKERDGRAKLIVINNFQTIKRKVVMPYIKMYVKEGATIHTDGAGIYKCLSKLGYEHKVVIRKKGVPIKKGIDNNGIEGLWGNIKTKIKATHRNIGRKYYQLYLDEFCFRYKRGFTECFNLLWSWICHP